MLTSIGKRIRSRLGIVSLFALFLLIASVVITNAAYTQDSFEKGISQTGYNKEKFDAQTFSDIVGIMNCALAGCSNQGTPDELKQGAVHTMGNMIAGLYSNPPASGAVYFADILNNFGIIESAYAQQGTGFAGLSPLRPIWKSFRDITYVLFVLVFAAMGIAIMFRFKLNTQTAITIQSALPRIVIALLLVTFSYAIAGLVIDFIYVLISLMVLAFSTVPGAPTDYWRTQFTEGGFLAVTSALLSVPGASGIIGFLLIGGMIGGAIGGILGSLAGPFAILPIAIGAGIGAGIMAIAVIGIVLYVLFRLFIELLKAYIYIIIAVILGPLQIALGVIPGFPGFGSWFKSLVANALAFPAVALVIMIGQMVVGQLRVVGGDTLWHPPLLASGGLAATFIGVLVGIGFLLIAYQVPQAVRNAMGIKDLGFSFARPLIFGGAPILAAAAMGRQTVTGAIGQIAGGFTRGFGMTPRNMRGIGAAGAARVLRRPRTGAP